MATNALTLDGRAMRQPLMEVVVGANSTIRITKTAARKYLLARVMDATDTQLADMLDGFLSERPYNAEIVVDGDRDADDDLLG